MDDEKKVIWEIHGMVSALKEKLQNHLDWSHEIHNRRDNDIQMLDTRVTKIERTIGSFSEDFNRVCKVVRVPVIGIGAVIIGGFGIMAWAWLMKLFHYVGTLGQNIKP